MIFTSEQRKKIQETKANEVEIRAKVDKQTLLQLLEKAGDKYEEICSISMMYGDYRRESFYVNKKKSRGEDIKKNKLFKINVGNFEVSFADEVNIDDFNVNCVDSLRFKYRRRFSMLGGKLDFTRFLDVKAYSFGILDSFFNFLDNETLGLWNLELEVEEDIEEAIMKLAEFMGTNDIVQNQLREFANLMGAAPKSLSIKTLGKNPVMLDKIVFKRISLSNFVILEKSDGVRAFMKFYDSGYILFMDGKTITHGECDGDFSLFDCEYMKNGTVKIFDLMLHNMKTENIGYLERMAIVKKMKLPKNCEIKKYYPATCENMKKVVKSEEAIDGIIFNEINKSYMQMDIFKWKPADQITFDFLVVPLPDNYKGVSPFIGNRNIYVLMNGCMASQLKRTGIKLFGRYKNLLNIYNIQYGNYNPIPFSPPVWRDAYVWHSDEKFNTMFVGEFRVVKKEWQLLRVRDDKTLLIKDRVYGNDYFVAEKHINELQDPLTIDMMCKAKTGSAYFANDKPTEYEEMTKFNGYVKYEILQILANVDKVLDIGSGKGQDIFKYPENIGSAMFVEPDKIAFIELNERLRKAKFKTSSVNESYENFIKLPHRFDAVVSNFACHYFLNSVKAYAEFAKYCSGVGASIVVLTYMNIDVMKLPLKNAKYNIYREGNKLFVKHHFSNEPYPENIVFTDELVKCMKKEKYNMIFRDSFGRFLEFKNLTDPLDKEYVSLYQYVVFRK